MKKYLLLLSALLIVFSSCRKAPIFYPAVQAASDDEAIRAYLTANQLTATKDPSGLYYSIVTPGTGAYPNSTSNVTVAYTGILLDGTQFDTQPSAYFSLATGVIKGWQIGVPKINVGGTIKLYIPSGLGYGYVATGSVPSNSVTIFTITLQGFNNSTL